MKRSFLLMKKRHASKRPAILAVLMVIGASVAWISSAHPGTQKLNARDGVVTARNSRPSRQSGSDSSTGRPGIALQTAEINVSDLVEKAKGRAVVRQRPIIRAESGPKPFDLPVPEGVLGQTETDQFNRSTNLASPFSALPTPEPTSSFAGPSDAGFVIPPDTEGAVGPNHIVTTLNSIIEIRSIQGDIVNLVILSDFWGSLGYQHHVGDARIQFDPFEKRWIYTISADGGTATSAIFIGVSETSDPTGKWHLYKVAADSSHLVWADFPSTGFNKHWIVVQSNMFSVGGNEFTQSNLYIFDKADLYSGGTGKHTLITRSDLGTNQAPAITYDNQVDTMYLLQNWSGNSNGQGVLRLYTISGDVGAEVLNPGQFISAGSPWDGHPPGFANFAPQLNSTQKIQNNDADFASVCYRNGSIWAAHTVFLPAGGSPTHSAIQWLQLSTDGTVIQTNRIEDETGQNYYAFPSIAINKLDDVLIGYSRFSATQYAAANFAFRRATDPINTLRADTVLKDGEAAYFKTFGGPDNRWGDYSATSVDPNNDLDFMTIQEYAAKPNQFGEDQWATWWGRISPPVDNPVSDLGISMVASPTSPVRGGQITYTIQATNTGVDTATGTVVSFTPDNAISVSVADASRGICTIPNGGRGVVSCNIGLLPTRQTVTIIVKAIIDLSAAGSITSTGQITSTALDQQPLNNQTSVSTNLISATELRVGTPSATIVTIGTKMDIQAFVIGPNGNGVQDMPVNFGLSFAPKPAAQLSNATQPSGFRGSSHLSRQTGFQRLAVALPNAAAALSQSIAFTDDRGVAVSSLNAGDAPGTLTLTVSAPGLGSKTLTITVVSGPDIKLTLTHFGNYKAGKRGELYVNLTNVGTLPLQGNTTVAIHFPADIDISFDPFQDCQRTSDGVICHMGLPGATGSTSTFMIHALSSKVGNYIITASDPLPNDSDLSNNDASDTITVESGSFDLSASASDSGNLKLHGFATLNFKISNLGPQGSTGTIRVDFTDPKGFDLSNATFEGWSCFNSSPRVCTYHGVIESGSSVTMSIKVAINSQDVQYGMVVSNDIEDNSANNSVTVTTHTVSVASTDLKFAASSDTPAITIGQNIVYKTTTTNAGPDAALSAAVFTRLPPGLTLVSVLNSNGDCQIIDIILCQLGDMDPNASADLTFVVKPSKVGPLDVTLNATSGTPEIFPENNNVTVSTMVHNPFPVLARLSPASGVAGGQGFTLTVNGSAFIPGTTVQWNGIGRPTTFVSDTVLTASIPASDLTSAKSATISVTNPSPGLETSGPLPFQISKGMATLSLNGLNQVYDGAPKTVTVTTTPVGLPGVIIVYDGGPTPPTNAGNYAVSVSLTNSDYDAIDVSGTLTIAKAEQTLSFPQISDKTLYESPIQLNASAASGLPISYEAIGSITVSGNTVTITGTGIATITASQPGNNNYNAAQSVTRTFNINNPSPQVRRIDPGAIIAGSAQTTLIVSGSNFVTDSLVKINGVNSPATFVNRIEMDIPLSAADLASPGTKTITITNPAPGGGNSIPVTLKIISITSSDSKNIQPGTTDTVSNAPGQSGDAGITAQLNHSQSAGGPATVTVKQYSADPLGGSGLIDVGGGYVDLKVTGSAPGDILNATFYYGSNVTGADEGKLQLLYFTGTKWAKVRSNGNTDPIKNTSDNQDGTVSGGSFTVVFDETSSPKLSQLTGTIFSSTPGLYGDLNNDQVINVVDLLLMANALAGNITVDKTAADLNQDAKFNVADLFSLANYLAGNIGHLPLGNGTPTANNPSDPVSFGYDFVEQRNRIDWWFPTKPVPKVTTISAAEISRADDDVLLPARRHTRI